MTLSRDDKLELLELLEEQAARKAAHSLAEYSHQMLGLAPAAHHLLMCEGLEQIERGQLDILILTLPPGSAKSSYGSVTFPSWYLGRHPERCVISASHTDELAERFGRKVRNTIASREHHRIFPDCQLSGDSTAAGRWETSKGGEYFAAGVGGSITGRRADLAIIDDPVKSREAADSETIREKQWAWFRDDLQTRLKPGAGIVLIMTRWHEDDLAGRLLEDCKTNGLRVRVIRVPMEAEEDDPLGRSPGEPLWPEWFTPVMIEQAKREPRTWTALYQQSPRPIGGGEFKLDWLCYYTRPPAATNRIIIVDPSSGKITNGKKRGDFTSMWVVGIGPDGNDYILDGLRDRLNLSQRTSALFGLVRRWKPLAVGYEEYGLQADIEHIKEKQEELQFRFRVIPMGGSMKKEDRIRKLIPSFEQGDIWMPRVMPRIRADGSPYDVIEELVAEYQSFPVAAHDDAMDCLARSREEAIRRYLIAPSHQTNDGFTASSAGWQPRDAEVGI